MPLKCSNNALCNLTFTNKLLLKRQNKKKDFKPKKFCILHFC